MNLGEICLIRHCWVNYKNATQIRIKEYGFDSHNIGNWFNFGQEVAIEIMFSLSKKNSGPGLEVETNESVFAKSM